MLGAERNVASFSSWSLPKVNSQLCNMKGFAALPLGCCDSTGQVHIRFLSIFFVAGKVQGSWREYWRLLSNLPGYWRPHKVHKQIFGLNRGELVSCDSSRWINVVVKELMVGINMKCCAAKERHGHLTSAYRAPTCIMVCGTEIILICESNALTKRRNLAELYQYVNMS